MKKLILLLMICSLVVSGCAFNIYKKNPKDKLEIDELTIEVDRLNRERALERKEFEDMKRDLERRLKGQATLEVEERGLVITLANNILFDSGKAKIKEDAYPVLDKIIVVINNKASDKNIGIEGHTDNVPIKYSSWRSNRELSTARANNVYHYLVDEGNLEPARLTTIGYGEFRPVADNDTEVSRSKNRRVEIVILPKYPKKDIGGSEESNWTK